MTISRAQKTKMSGDAGMEKMYFRLQNRTTDVMANCALTRQKLRGTGKSHPKIKCLQTIYVLAKYSILIYFITYVDVHKRFDLDLSMGSLSIPRTKFKNFWNSLVSLIVRQ